MKSSLILVLNLLSLSVFADPEYETLSKIYSPVIEGDTLIFKGRVDSHFYDFLTYEAKKIEKVKYVSLNSYGGNHNWAIEISTKLQSLNKITIVKKDNVCASACVYLFAAGKERIMEKTTWLGVHGARIAGGYISTFAGSCFVTVEGGLEYSENKTGCQDFLVTWHEVSLKATTAAFDMMEISGVSPEARKYYFSLEDDPKWYEQLNVLKKPDWVVDTDAALQFNFATQVTD